MSAVALFRRDRQPAMTAVPVPDLLPVPLTDERAVAAYMVRAPTAATVTPNRVGVNLGQFTGSWDVEKAIREHYLCNTYLYSAVRALGEDLASLTLRVGPDPDNAQKFDVNHPIAGRLSIGKGGMPNSQTTAAQLWQWTVAQFVVTGRFGWEVDRGDGSLWPLISHRIYPVPTEGGDSYFAKFLYDVGQGRKKELARDQVIYHWRPSISDWRQPESVIQAAGLDLSVAVMQDLYDYAFLRNDARPATVVVHEAFEDEVQRDAWRRQFTQTHRGPSNAGKVAFAQASPDGATAKDALFIQTLGLSQKDAEFIQRYQAKIRSILLSVGVPLTRLGDASARTFANADEEMQAYWKNTVRQLAINLAGALNLYVAPRYGSDVCWFDFSENEYLREPKKFKIYEAIAGVKQGIISVEEARVEAFGLPEVPEMGVLVAPAPTGTAALPVPAADTPPAQDTGTAADGQFAVAAGVDGPTVTRMIQEALQAHRAIPLDPPARTAETAEEARARRGRQWRSFDATTGPMEKKWGRRWQRFFDRQAEAVIARLNGKRGRQALRDTVNVSAVFDRDYWLSQTEDLTQDMYEDVVATSFAAFDSAVGIAFDVAAPFARAFIEARANQLAGQVTATTYDAIKAALSEGAGKGESIPDLAARIETLFAQTYANRAVTVARTEVISGYNGGTVEAARQTDGVVEKLEWISTADDRTRGNNSTDEYDHLVMDGVQIGLDEQFDVQGDMLDYPGDPSGDAANVINCRCTTAPVVAEDVGNRSAVVVDLAAWMASGVAQGRFRVTDPRKALTAH